jgi:hypothetical protein
MQLRQGVEEKKKRKKKLAHTSKTHKQISKVKAGATWQY